MIHRRAFFGLLGAVAAPYVIRDSGILMPVRDRKPLVTLEEVIEWREGMAELAKRRVLINFNALGAADMLRMSEAEARYQAMGLLSDRPAYFGRGSS
jgi:hypothetical protein